MKWMNEWFPNCQMEIPLKITRQKEVIYESLDRGWLNMYSEMQGHTARVVEILDL